MDIPYLIGITGGSGSGKTEFLNGLLKRIDENKVCIISQDNYYKPRDTQPVDNLGIKNFDLPESVDLEAFKNDIVSLKEGLGVAREEYTFNNPNIKPKIITLVSAPVIVVEGLFVLFYRGIARLLDLKLFIEAKEHLMLKRRIIRDEKERGYGLDDVLYRYENHVMPTYEKYIKPFKSEADIVIANHRDCNEALDVIAAFVHSKVG